MTLCIVWHDFSDNVKYCLVTFPWQHYDLPGLISWITLCIAWFDLLDNIVHRLV